MMVAGIGKCALNNRKDICIETPMMRNIQDHTYHDGRYLKEGELSPNG